MMTSAERKSGGRESITDVSLTSNEWKRENVRSQRKKKTLLVRPNIESFESQGSTEGTTSGDNKIDKRSTKINKE